MSIALSPPGIPPEPLRHMVTVPGYGVWPAGHLGENSKGTGFGNGAICQWSRVFPDLKVWEPESGLYALVCLDGGQERRGSEV